MAISKVALAGSALLEDGLIREVRIAAASLAAFPARLLATERALTGGPIDSNIIESAKAALLSEGKPIDDIRSSAEYRIRVAANLLEEFLNQLRTAVSPT